MHRAQISPSQLARACEVSPAAVSKWLNGETKRLQHSVALRVAGILRVDPDWLNSGATPVISDELLTYHHDVRLLVELKARMEADLRLIDELLKRTGTPAKPRPSNNTKKQSA